MSPPLATSAVIPTPVFRLGVGDQLERLIENITEHLVIRHAVGLTKSEGGQAVIVHVPLGVRDIQQARGLGIPGHEIQCPLNGVAIAAASGQIARGEKRECAHPHQAQVIGVPVSLRSLVPGKPFESFLQSSLTRRRHLPLTFGKNR